VNDIEKRTKERTNDQNIEIFSTGCPSCEETIKMVNWIACSSCEVIDGELAACCRAAEPDEATLRTAGVGQQIAQA
jgi:glutaredoxin 3